MDGMLEETAVCWNSQEKKIEYHQVGYYGCDGQNMCQTSCEVDATPETWKEIIHYYLKPAAYAAFEKSVIEYKQAIHIDTTAEVIRGKKVPKGTVVKVFWIGDRPTFRARRYEWMRETERIAGCKDEAGNKYWIKAEYLKNIDPLKSPCASERKKFIHAWIYEQAKLLGAPWKLRERG